MMQSDERSGSGKRTGPSDEEISRLTPPSAGGREVRIGIFVLIGFVGTIVLLFLLTDPATFRGRYIVATEVADAGGVRRGDPVQMRGVNIGRVHRFEMASEGVLMSLEINGRWRIPTDSYTRISGLGLLGGRTVEVIPGTASSTITAGAILRGDSGERVEALAEEVGGEVRDLLARASLLMADSTIHSVQSSASEMEALLQALNAVVDEQRSELRALTASLLISARQIEEAAPGEELTRALARADSTLARFEVAGESLTRASSTLEVILGRLERGEGTLGRLAADDALYDNLTAATDEFRALIRDIQANPGRYIRLRIF
jgi:phospholipid/cholesterol/gamma-HCH transport system substrate-binding protein